MTEGIISMSRSSARIPRHVFLSYSRKDRTLADRLLEDLRNLGFQVWIDDQGIEPGTPNWEARVRQAVAESYAVVLVCTPNTADSQYIPAELQLAEKSSCRIIPVWIEGENWIDCVPLGMVNCQNIDSRGERYATGLTALGPQLRNEISRRQPKLGLVDSLEDCPDNFVHLLIAQQDGQQLDLHGAGYIAEMLPLGRLPNAFQLLAINPSAYPSFEELLNDIYTGFLTRRYTPYTYGKEWVIVKASTHVSLLAVPWIWLRDKRAKALIEVIPDYLERRTSLSEYGFGEPQRGRPPVWAVVDQGFEEACGLFTSENRIGEEALSSGSMKGFSFRLHERVTFRLHPGGQVLADQVRQLHELDPELYRYKLVISPHNLSRLQGLGNGVVIVIENRQPGGGVSNSPAAREAGAGETP
jgi:hypothetical protein